MVDTVTSTTLFNDKKRLVMQFTNLSDGSGESAVVKVDKSTFTGLDGTEPSSLAIEKIEGEVVGMSVKIYADHSTDVQIALLQTGPICLDYTEIGGLQTSGSGETGDITFTTSGHTSGDSYNLKLTMRKKD